MILCSTLAIITFPTSPHSFENSSSQSNHNDIPLDNKIADSDNAPSFSEYAGKVYQETQLLIGNYLYDAGSPLSIDLYRMTLNTSLRNPLVDWSTLYSATLRALQLFHDTGQHNSVISTAMLAIANLSRRDDYYEQTDPVFVLLTRIAASSLQIDHGRSCALYYLSAFLLLPYLSDNFKIDETTSEEELLIEIFRSATPCLGLWQPQQFLHSLKNKTKDIDFLSTQN
ncbi:MAG: hypothetical protein AAFY02_20045, partial [Pseudomonadota bacterium]